MDAQTAYPAKPAVQFSAREMKFYYSLKLI